MFTGDIIQSFQVHGFVQSDPVCLCTYSLHCEYLPVHVAFFLSAKINIHRYNDVIRALQQYC